MLRRVGLPLFGLGCALGLGLICFRGVLFKGGQFAYRDAAYFYYPLYLRVQQEWAAGRWPLWDPWQNSGMPLLGNPVAAVLYPGKLIYAVLPYAWAARVYVLAHTAWAFLGVLVLTRTWGVSWAGAFLGALSYAFGAPVLSQYCNVIFLVGASWLPWGFRAMDRLLRRGQLWGLIGLAMVLAMQTLGGDPEAAYLTVLCGGVYAAVLAPPDEGEREPSRPGFLRGWRGMASLAVVLWVVLVLGAAYLAPRWRRLDRWPWREVIWAVVWGGAAVGVIRGWLRSRSEARTGPRLAGLAGACVLALLIASAQLVPTLELARRSVRATGRPLTTLYMFSLDPARVVEMVWPNVFGLGAPENHAWFTALPPVNQHQAWSPSLYAGALTVLLALAAAGFRGGSPWRRWASVIVLAGFLASLGKYAGPLWWIRWLPGTQGFFGPHDPPVHLVREDGSLGDGFGSPYGMLTVLLPGFALFRYPSKLLPFVFLGISVLAGLGWDLLASGRSVRRMRWGNWGLLVTSAVLAFVVLARRELAAILGERLRSFPDPGFGPIDVDAALTETMRGLVQGGIVLAVGMYLARLAARRPRLAAVSALIVLTADLGLANSRLIWTAPQASFDREPEAVRQIEAAEREGPSRGLFRVHRMPFWDPVAFSRYRSPARFQELIRWERDTLQSLNGLPYDTSYTLIADLLEPPGYREFFDADLVKVRGPMARALRVNDGTTVIYAPRRSFDLWNTRYFLVPVQSGDWTTHARAYASLLPETELIYPDRATLQEQGPDSWRERQDWMLLRNKAAFPRAWLVHSGRVHPPGKIPPADRERLTLTRDQLFQTDPFLRRPELPVHDLRTMAFVEADDPSVLSRYLDGSPVDPSESVAITAYEPQRVELSAELKRPGLVVLADLDYPGWRLEIDGHPAPILRVNRLMRGAAVPAGSHRLIYTYAPRSFHLGLGLSIAGLIALAVLTARAAQGSRRGRQP